jgi:DNA-directed RNA polymerase subunit RPC12/RpoP
MMKNEIRKCCICGNEFQISEIAKAYVKKGKAIYVCVGCHRKIKKLPGEGDMV